jgi:ABC-2 type transport system ATP-binding protein
MDDFLLQTNAITKEFKNIKAVDHIDLKLKRGEVYGLIGRNGAGKTTLLRMLAGLAQPTEGNYTLFGLSGKKIAALRDRVGVLIEAPGLFGNMNAMQNMKVKAMALGLKEDDYIRELLSSVGLSSSDKRPVRDYSLGMKQRLGIAMALIGHPDLLLLDEPINGLDPEGIIEVRELLDKLSKEQNITILISSHILEELSKTATRFGIINRGRLISEFTREELYEECRQFIEIKTEDIDSASTLIERMGIRDFKIVDKTTLKIYERLDAVGSVISELENNGVKVISVDTGRRSLEEYYISLVDHDDKVTAGK